MGNNNILFIGLNGYAGSGKDTLAKALKIMLDNKFTTFEDFITYYNEHEGYGIKHDFKYATSINKNNTMKERCMCIAFADQLKKICSDMFGIPVERFYYNKGNSFVCINKDFEYTEEEPTGHLIDAEEYYYNNDEISSSDERYYMSLREILVYVGTYLVQQNINKLTFVNIVNNTIEHIKDNNENLSYVICTDVRFQHEFDYIKKKHGIMINIVRDDVEQLDNVAEHSFDDTDKTEFDYVIENNSTYEDMFKQMWDIIHRNVIFYNQTINLETRDKTPNYLRLINIDINDGFLDFEVCTEYSLRRISSADNKIQLIDLQGGPSFEVNSLINAKSGVINYLIQSIQSIDDYNYNKYILKCKILGDDL